MTLSNCLICLALIAACAAGNGDAYGASSKGDSMHNLYQMPEGDVQTRWFTGENVNGAKGEAAKGFFGRKANPNVFIAAGKSYTLADISGPGTIRRIWMTCGPQSGEMLRGAKIEIYWDGAKTPAVQAPIGDFFCHSLGHMVTFENAYFSSPEGRSFNCIIPMPFRKGARVLLVNEAQEDLNLYYEVDATTGDAHDKNMLYFHSYWRRENYTKARQDMTIMPEVHGRGRLLGCNIGVRLHPSMTNFWFGEGEVKVYLDGDMANPTLCGTGTEDFIGSGWGQGRFCNAYQGCQFVNQPEGAPLPIGYGFYRLFVPDPIYFHKDIRATIQAIGMANGQQLLDAIDKAPSVKFMKRGDGTEYYTREEVAKNPGGGYYIERTDDYSTTAYWYMDKPENGLPPIAPVSERVKDLP